MLTEKIITASCTINKGVVIKDGLNIFENHTDIATFLLSVYQHFKFSYPKFYKMDNLSKLGWLAAEILLKDSFKKGKYKPEDVGIILANASSSLDDDIKYFETVKEMASPALFVYTLPNIVIGEICIRNSFKGEHTFFIQDKFDAGFVARQVNYILDNNILQTCICGWVDILGQDYKAALFLVEKTKGEKGVAFSAESMDKIFNNN